MGLDSDFAVNAAQFSTNSFSEHTKQFNAGLVDIMAKGPKWYEESISFHLPSHRVTTNGLLQVGAEKYRQMRWNGETPFPKPVLDEDAKADSIPSRDKGREIPTRVFTPKSGNSKGVYMHIHGGGWVLQNEMSQDQLLRFTAESAQVTVVSIGYRLAPENPFPAGPHDCYDAGDFLVDNAKSKYGGDLLFVGGESAGGHLSACVTLHLLKSRPNFSFKGVILHYGAFDLAGKLPQVHNFVPHGYGKDACLILDGDLIDKYTDAFLPNTTEAQRRDPYVSPLYADLKQTAAGNKKGLPPVLFTCGSEDPLLDDTVFFSAKWMMAGGKAIVKIYPGAPHGFSLMPRGASEDAKKGTDDQTEFMLAMMGGGL